MFFYTIHDAYIELYTLCFLDDKLCFPTQKHYDILFYDLLMAEKYDDMDACYEKNGGEHLDSGSPPFTFYIIR